MLWLMYRYDLYERRLWAITIEFSRRKTIQARQLYVGLVKFFTVSADKSLPDGFVQLQVKIEFILPVRIAERNYGRGAEALINCPVPRPLFHF